MLDGLKSVSYTHLDVYKRQSMYGAILGDIAGSKYEFSRPEKFDPWKVKIFANDCCFTDDTVMTIATKYAFLKGTPYAKAYGVVDVYKRQV